jgi:hypothetical protein
MTNQKPSLGRIVHFVLPWEPRVGLHRPAIVTASADPFGEIVNLRVFLEDGDVRNDIGGFHESVFVERVKLSTTEAPGSWHWPEREG